MLIYICILDPIGKVFPSRPEFIRRRNLSPDASLSVFELDLTYNVRSIYIGKCSFF